jgi:hypothetical protein
VRPDEAGGGSSLFQAELTLEEGRLFLLLLALSSGRSGAAVDIC